MKSTGIVRKVDNLGRAVIPIETRRILDIAPGDSLEIYTDKGCIILKKYVPACACVFCGETDGVQVFKEKNICAACALALKGAK